MTHIYQFSDPKEKFLAQISIDNQDNGLGIHDGLTRF